MRLLYGGRTGANNMNGKGDRQRPTDLKKYAKNYDAIFKKPLLKYNPATTIYSFIKKTFTCKHKTK